MSSDTRSYIVADLMTLEPIVVRETDSVAFADTVLRDFRISGLPVVDEAGRLVGVYSTTDALHLKVAGVRSVQGRVANVAVGEVMSTPAVTVSSLAPLEAAAAIMLEAEVHRLVAVDDVGRPIGVLSAMDYVRLATEGS